jgi:hypothetical protein
MVAVVLAGTCLYLAFARMLRLAAVLFLRAIQTSYAIVVVDVDVLDVLDDVELVELEVLDVLELVELVDVEVELELVDVLVE